ncbi:MAG: MerR family transcriptional regulator [Thermoleophilia bacterium]|nr:MerR family transcriptional regulator [Thermoleophilia bacterium]
MTSRRDDSRPVFMIGIAAEMAGVHPQTLRTYERRGLLSPGRTTGRTRLYSEADLARLRHIHTLSVSGVNLAGIVAIMGLERQLERARARIREVEDDRDMRMAEHARAVEACRRMTSTELVPMRHAGGVPAVRVTPIIPAGLRPVLRSQPGSDPRRSR